MPLRTPPDAPPLRPGPAHGDPPRRRPADPPALTHWWIWITYAALFALSIPWYFPAGRLDVWLGLPSWVVVSVLATLAIALFTVFVVWRCWPDEEPADGDTPT